MTNIYPFKAITNHQRYKAFKTHRGSLEDKLVHLTELLQKGLLYQHQEENFYCCKISNDYFSVIGLIALINTSLGGKLILRHEKSIYSKEEIYINNLQKYKIQLSPIMLIHEDNPITKQTFSQIMNSKEPFLKTKDKEHTFEIWTTDNISTYKKLFKNINTFWLADGHHRLAAINKLDTNNLICAFLIAKEYIKSADIYREYISISTIDKQKLLSFLCANFFVSKINFTNNLLGKNFIIMLGPCEVYEVHNSTTDLARRKILEFLETSINYYNKELNFYNYHLKENSINNKGVTIIIPAYKFSPYIKEIDLFPPHSTLFYPKIPDGLILNHINKR